MPRLLHPEEHLPPPQPGGRRCGDLTSLFTDPRCADALVATLACGFGLREWRVVWDLRAVSHACYHAVQNDDLWRQMYDTLANAAMPVTASAGQAFLGPGPPSVTRQTYRLAPSLVLHLVR